LEGGGGGGVGGRCRTLAKGALERWRAAALEGGEGEAKGKGKGSLSASKLYLQRLQQAQRRLESGALEGGALEGGALEGGALEGGALEGGALEGGALEGGARCRTLAAKSKVEREDGPAGPGCAHTCNVVRGGRGPSC
jgi:hypothetical protein